MTSTSVKKLLHGMLDSVLDALEIICEHPQQNLNGHSSQAVILPIGICLARKEGLYNSFCALVLSCLCN